jgi:hypothetical protein
MSLSILTRSRIVFITASASQIIFKKKEEGKMICFEEELRSSASSNGYSVGESGVEESESVVSDRDLDESDLHDEEKQSKWDDVVSNRDLDERDINDEENESSPDGVMSDRDLYESDLHDEENESDLDDVMSDRDLDKRNLNNEESEIGTIDLSSDTEVVATATVNDPTKAFAYVSLMNKKQSKTTQTQRAYCANGVTGKLTWFAPPPDAPCHNLPPRKNTVYSYGFAPPPTTAASEVLRNGVDTSIFYAPPPPPDSPPPPYVP